MKVPDLTDLEMADVHAWHGDMQALGDAINAAKLRLRDERLPRLLA